MKGETTVPYVDGFVLAVPKRKLESYRRISRAAGKVWREHGALDTGSAWATT